LLPVVVACRSARPGTLLLLQNPEAHLHPQGQTQMATLTASAAAQGAQVIMETHSDHVINGVRLAVKHGRLTPAQAVFHYFRGDGTGVEIVSPRIDADGMLDKWPEGFFDELENTLDQLIG
ncbi:AAA family ATPase, partial [[Kitasatospora] papulosa]|uniref:AAA family ATPase n=1 Tax=[Kitasatospora] papulosa TaxID=1464011 RepID=UPI0036C5B9B1